LSVRQLLTRPGALTAAHLRGQKKPYLLPFQLFLMANLLFFAVQSLSGVMIFATPIDSHLRNDLRGPAAKRLVTWRIEATHSSLADDAPVFDRAVALNAKSLVILMALAFAVPLPMIFHGSGRPFVTHLVFSLHFYAFVLLLFCVALTIAALDVSLGGPGLQSIPFDHTLSIIELVVCFAYLYVAIRKVYGVSGAARVLDVVALTIASAAIVLGYRFVLLPITLCTA
jgi:uncharacterized protein DUF3667